MARSLEDKLSELIETSAKAVNNSEKSGGEQPAHTLSGRLEQASRWLQHPDNPNNQTIGYTAAQLIVHNGRKVNVKKFYFYFTDYYVISIFLSY